MYHIVMEPEQQSDLPILVERQEGVCRIVLNRPSRLNSFTEQMIAQLTEELTRIAADSSVRAVVITGAGRGFCAGQDLNERSVAAEADKPDLGMSLSKRYNPLIQQLAGLPKPTIAAVNGAAAGAGCSIALACDIVLAAQSAKFLLAFARIGLVPDTGSTWLLPRLVGAARARAMAMLAEPVDAQQAQQWGMIWQCVPDDQLAEQASDLAAQLAQGPTHAYSSIKKLFALSADNCFDAQLTAESVAQREAGRTADYAEGVAAFLAKRKAEFQGR